MAISFRYISNKTVNSSIKLQLLPQTMNQSCFRHYDAPTFKTDCLVSNVQQVKYVLLLVILMATNTSLP